jgi:2-methylcitrate dehydratase PrpD
VIEESITRRLAKFVTGISYENLPREVTDRAKMLILDALGNAIAGRDMPSSRMALELVKGDIGNVTVLTHPYKVPTQDASFANSVLAFSTSQDDFLFSFHPGIVIIPTAIAVAEQEASSGAELMNAVIAGYELMGRVYLGAPDIAAGFRGISVFGPFGAAAAAGKLLRLNEDQLTHALGYAANLASGLTQCLKSGTMEPYFHGGFAARSGIMAASLAKVGAVAAENILEGELGFYKAFSGTTNDVRKAMADLGKRLLIMEVSYKPYPVCGLQQIPVDLILRLKRQHRVMSKDIKEIVEEVPYSDATHPGNDFAGPFENASQALLSAQFCAAAAFLDKPVESPALYMEKHSDPDVFALAQKVRLIGEKDRKLPKITVALQNGEEYSIEEGEKQGTLTPTDEKIIAKFHKLTSSYLEQKRASEIVRAIISLEKVTNIQELVHLLAPASIPVLMKGDK